MNGKLAKVDITIESLTQLMTKGISFNLINTIEGLPAGANCVDFWVEREKGIVSLLYYHESFKTISSGESYPTILTVMENNYGGPQNKYGTA